MIERQPAGKRQVKERGSGFDYSHGYVAIERTRLYPSAEQGVHDENDYVGALFFWRDMRQAHQLVVVVGRE